MSPETKQQIETMLENIVKAAGCRDTYDDDARKECGEFAEAALALLRDEGDGWCYDMEKAPRNWPIQLLCEDWSKPRSANWSSGSWWTNGLPVRGAPLCWAPMLPTPPERI